MKVAILGGSFNPIHNGHLKIAKNILQDNIDQVWIVPCGNHAFNKALASGKDRMNMINLAVGNNPRVKVVSVELNPNKISYTSETMKWFKSQFEHDFFFVVGADNLKDIEKWHDFEYLKNNLDFIVVKRPENDIISSKIKISKVLSLNESVSSSEIRNNLKNKLSISHLVPKNVEEYISKEGLYND